MFRRRMEPDTPVPRRPRPVSRWSLFGLLLLTLPAWAAPLHLAVFYPEVSSAYAQVFASIIDGLRSVEGASVTTREVSAATTAAELEGWLTQQRPDGVVALGQTGYQLARQLKPGVPLVVGAAMLTPGGPSGISLAADPEELFSYLQNLAPPVRRVFMVYHPESSGWLLPAARAAAARRNMEFIAREAADSREAALAYRKVLEEEVQEAQDALWLPLDTAAPDASVLPLVLETAWRKRLVVFSNNVAHAKKGALFAVVPDNFNLGVRLGQLFLRVRQQRTQEVLPLSDVKVAVNVRTASHLGRLYSSNEQRSFALVFPSE